MLDRAGTRRLLGMAVWAVISTLPQPQLPSARYVGMMSACGSQLRLVLSGS